ncbi:MAG: hypothetical protein WBX07_01980, partial [Rhodoplanes sp.]
EKGQPMTSAKCLVADDRSIFCVLGRLFRLDAQGESLRYLRLCTCVACSKTLHHRQQMQKIASIVLDEGEVK